jgi:tRNA A37 threonylcarbamoyladenosine dehydratase
VDVRTEFFSDETAASILDTPADEPLDFVVDAIDSLLSKVNLIVACRDRGIPIVSAMGAADRMDQSAVHVTDIGESYNCPLAKHVRKRLHKRGIFDGVMAVWSSEGPCHGAADSDADDDRDPPEIDGATRGRERPPLPSTAPLPGIFGLSAANWVIRSILEKAKVG